MMTKQKPKTHKAFVVVTPKGELALATIRSSASWSKDALWYDDYKNGYRVKEIEIRIKEKK